MDLKETKENRPRSYKYFQSTADLISEKVVPTGKFSVEIKGFEKDLFFTEVEANMDIKVTFLNFKYLIYRKLYHLLRNPYNYLHLLRNLVIKVDY